MLGGGEGQPVAGFGTGGYALFGDVQIPAAPSRMRVYLDGRILAVGGVGCADNINPDDTAAGSAHCSSHDTCRRARRILRSGRTVAP